MASPIVESSPRFPVEMENACASGNQPSQNDSPNNNIIAVQKYGMPCRKNEMPTDVSSNIEPRRHAATMPTVQPTRNEMIVAVSTSPSVYGSACHSTGRTERLGGCQILRGITTGQPRQCEIQGRREKYGDYRERDPAHHISRRIPL